MEQYQCPKGVFDLLPNPTAEGESWKNTHLWLYVEEVIRSVATQFGYREIRTPIFERTELFTRSVGESSDIVTKEMYTFLDKGGRSMTLRPEGTASVIRALIEHRLDLNDPIQKYFYMGPMFRYERPQGGRYRQLHQFGAEAVGISTPEQDVEMIHLLCTIYERLGLSNLHVMVNSVGNSRARENYRARLRSFLQPRFDELSDDSQRRFTDNPLRILDSKSPEDQKILEGAPLLCECLDEDSALHFDRVQELLGELKIAYSINEKLVRGLDYYNHTVFEVTSSDLFAHNTIGAGGRYDGLSKQLGGPDLPSVGFATGIERIIQTMQRQNAFFPNKNHPYLFLAPIGEKAEVFCFALLCQLRTSGIATEMSLKKGVKIGSLLKLASDVGAAYTLVIGDHELHIGKASLKEMLTGNKEDIALASIGKEIEKLWRLKKEEN